MGNDWWVNKLRKYKLVRKKITAAGGNIDELAEIEMARFAEDEARQKRMTNRDEQIRTETSAVRRIILHAQQLADELV